jgi:hypothetical protein
MFRLRFSKCAQRVRTLIVKTILAVYYAVIPVRLSAYTLNRLAKTTIKSPSPD